jgi:hypothetical protein
MRHQSSLTTHLVTVLAILLSASSLTATDTPPSLAQIRAGMESCAEQLKRGQTDQTTQQQQTKTADMLGVLIAAIEKQEQQSQQQAAGQGQPGQASASQSGQGREAGQGGQTGGGSRGAAQNAAQAAENAGPQSPWSTLRDRQRDPVYNAIQERFPARYQQLLEQYYKSFQEPPRVPR